VNHDGLQIRREPIANDRGDISPILGIRYARAPKFEDDPR
jgi:hypothetical protein